MVLKLVYEILDFFYASFLVLALVWPRPCKRKQSQEVCFKRQSSLMSLD